MAVIGLSGLFQTVVSKFTEATKVLAPTHDAMNSIYWDYQPDQFGAIGQTLNVAIPIDPTSLVQDVGVGNVVVSDQGFTTVPIVLNRHPQLAFPVRDFEQVNTPYMIQKNLVYASMTAIKNNINAAVTSLFNSTNFAINTPISTTGGVVTVTQFLQGQTVLADKYVPVVADPRNMTFLAPSTPYMKMQDGTTGGAGAAWSQAFIVGNTTAENIHKDGKVPIAFATTFALDQQMPTTGTVGSRTFTSVLHHKFSVGGMTRAIATPPEADKVMETAYINWGGISLRVCLGYSMVPYGGNIFMVDAAYGLKVVRPEMAQLFSTAE